MTRPMRPTTLNTPATAALFEKKLLFVALTETAEGVLLSVADTKVVETSVITAGKPEDGVLVMMSRLVAVLGVGISGVVEVVVVVELELLELLVREVVEEEVAVVVDDEDEDEDEDEDDVGEEIDRGNGKLNGCVDVEVLEADEVVGSVFVVEVAIF